MASIVLPKGSIISMAGNALTEHNRSPVSVSIERIETSQRMANGSLRKYVIADKKKWSMSWDMCPNDSVKTVDGKWGGNDMYTFYSSTPGIFILTVKNGAATETYNAVISEFGYEIQKRGAYDAWNINLTLEEA